MANWTKNEPCGSSNRRKWDLENRASLNNLKYHIANEGCSDAQYDLAKQFLEKPEENNDDEHQSEQAIHWLLCATEQGHSEASKLLRKCYIENRGITENNEAEVRSCLTMTKGELAARKAARDLFACLSNGNEHITPKQLERKMRAIYNIQKKHRRPGHLLDYASDGEDDEDVDEIENEHDIRIRAGENGALANGKMSHRRRHLVDRLSNNSRSENRELITEDNLVAAAVNYAAGRLPSVNDALTLSIPHPATLDHVPCFHRLFLHPFIFFTLLYHRLISFIATLPHNFTPTLRFVCLLTIYILMSTENLATFLPLVFYYLSLCLMVWSTCKMLRTKHNFIDFRIWSGLFLSYGDNNIEADLSEQRFLRNNMRPYFYYFCAFVTNLFIIPFLSSEWLPHSEITIICCVFVFITLLAFMYSATTQPFPDLLVLVSFGINVLAKYPYEMDEVVSTSWRFLDLKAPTFCSFVIGNGIEFCLNCRTALYLLIPGFLLILAKRSNWHGVYTHLIPHCVTLSWLQLCFMASQRATMFGVVRGTLALAGILLFLPLFGIVSLLIPIFVAIEWLGFVEPSIRLGSTVLLLIVAIIGSCFLAINRLTQKYVTTLQVLLGLIAACVLTLPYMTSNFKYATDMQNLPHVKHAHDNNLVHNVPESIIIANEHHNNINWQRFYAMCGPTAWQQNVNKITTQMRCAPLEGMPVIWEGTVAEVQIARSRNTLEEFMSKYLPKWLANTMRCLIGEQIKLSCELDAINCEDLEPQLQYKCTLLKWNVYDYELLLHMPSAGLLSKSAEIVLKASDKFGNFTKRLVAGDRIRFSGTLLNSHELSTGARDTCLLGSSVRTYVQLTAVECKICLDKEIPAVSNERVNHSGKSLVDARMRDLMRGIKYLLNVLFNPLITFK